MGPVSFVIALLGCADGSGACRPVALIPARYESRQACAAAAGGVLAVNTDFDFPTIVAECRAAKAPASSGARPARSAIRDASLG